MTPEQERLVEDNLDLAQRIASLDCWNRNDAADRLSDAYFGLVEAARRFDPSKASFRHYAGLRIRFAIKDGYRRRWVLTRDARNAGWSEVRLEGMADMDELEGALVDEGSLVAFEDVEDADELDRWRALVARRLHLLPATQREVVEAQLANAGACEIAGQLGVTDSAVCHRSSKAVKRLQVACGVAA